jgi:DNA-binding beta-propeller fold protein YncE
MPDGVAFDPRGGFAFTADGGNNTVSVFRLNSSGALASYRPPVPAGVDPIAVSVDYSGKFVVVVTSGGGVLSYAIDRDAQTLIPVDAESVDPVTSSNVLTLSTHAE